MMRVLLHRTPRRADRPRLEPIWNLHYVENVLITRAESFGVKGRGNFYEETGVIRDVIQNHLQDVVADVGRWNTPQ
jgi:glucose-6-phosphate 1-dehydrogenase